MLQAADIEAALRQALPTEYHSVIPQLAQIIAEASTGALSPDEAQARLAANTDLADALRALNGRRVEAGSSVISFNGAQTGDVTISGDVAGGDIIKIQINNNVVYNVGFLNPVSKLPEKVTTLQEIADFWKRVFRGAAYSSDGDLAFLKEFAVPWQQAIQEKLTSNDFMKAIEKPVIAPRTWSPSDVIVDSGLRKKGSNTSGMQFLYKEYQFAGVSFFFNTTVDYLSHGSIAKVCRDIICQSAIDVAGLISKPRVDWHLVRLHTEFYFATSDVLVVIAVHSEDLEDLTQSILLIPETLERVNEWVERNGVMRKNMMFAISNGFLSRQPRFID